MSSVRRSWGMRPTARTPSCEEISMTLASSTCSRSTRRRACSRRKPPSHCLSALARQVGRELDYKQLKGDLGLDHYEGRSYLGWHHHTALVTAAHGFLTLERLCPRARRPA